MKKTAKILRIILLAVLLIVLLLIVGFNLFANSLLKTAIETAATSALKVKVSLGSINLSVLGGKISLENLLIDNPPGYQNPRLLELKKASVSVDIKSLLSDTVRIKEIIFDGVNLTMEQRGISGNNLQDIINALPAGEKQAAPQQPQQQPSGKKLVISNLEISNVAVNVKLLPLPGKSDTVTMKLAPIVMKDLGTDSKMDIAMLSGKILTAIAEGVVKQGTDLLPREMTDTMKSTLSKTGAVVSEEGKKVIETGKDLGKGITDGLKGLLKKK
jgi:hypothetical protein